MPRCFRSKRGRSLCRLAPRQDAVQPDRAHRQHLDGKVERAVTMTPEQWQRVRDVLAQRGQFQAEPAGAQPERRGVLMVDVMAGGGGNKLEEVPLAAGLRGSRNR